MEMQLVGFLLARIAEDERVATAEREWMRQRYPGEPDNTDIELETDKDGAVNISDARATAECEARRAIVMWCVDGQNGGPWESLDGVPDYEQPLRFLAAPYAAHPEYRSEWKP